MKKFVVVDKEAMANGYKEMAELNLAISKTDLWAEEEGWGLFNEKMDTKKTGDSA